jgi:hypothetical protein
MTPSLSAEGRKTAKHKLAGGILMGTIAQMARQPYSPVQRRTISSGASGLSPGARIER